MALKIVRSFDKLHGQRCPTKIVPTIRSSYPLCTQYPTILCPSTLCISQLNPRYRQYIQTPRLCPGTKAFNYLVYCIFSSLGTKSVRTYAVTSLQIKYSLQRLATRFIYYETYSQFILQRIISQKFILQIFQASGNTTDDCIIEYVRNSRIDVHVMRGCISDLLILLPKDNAVETKWKIKRNVVINQRQNVQNFLSPDNKMAPE